MNERNMTKHSGPRKLTEKEIDEVNGGKYGSLWDWVKPNPIRIPPIRYIRNLWR